MNNKVGKGKKIQIYTDMKKCYANNFRIFISFEIENH